jgi:Flp pilus assembly protein TadB
MDDGSDIGSHEYAVVWWVIFFLLAWWGVAMFLWRVWWPRRHRRHRKRRRSRESDEMEGATDEVQRAADDRVGPAAPEETKVQPSR